jgi:hypothetical protein
MILKGMWRRSAGVLNRFLLSAPEVVNKWSSLSRIKHARFSPKSGLVKVDRQALIALVPEYSITVGASTLSANRCVMEVCRSE